MRRREFFAAVSSVLAGFLLPVVGFKTTDDALLRLGFRDTGFSYPGSNIGKTYIKQCASWYIQVQPNVSRIWMITPSDFVYGGSLMTQILWPRTEAEFYRLLQ
jgi:hypothetical protein